jgi:hypothetical protein
LRRGEEDEDEDEEKKKEEEEEEKKGKKRPQLCRDSSILRSTVLCSIILV